MHEADKELLIRFFHNNCRPEELPAVHQLLRHPEAEAFFKELAESEWSAPLEKNEQHQALYNSWKEKVNARILGKEPVAKPGMLKRLYRFRHAAVLTGLLLVAAGIIWHYTGNTGKATTPAMALIVKKNESGIPVRYKLPDSSELYLAAGSKVSCPESFTGATRELTLEGEAFFDIKPNPDQPFIIHSGDVHTQVLGTSFKVTALKNRPLEVAVATGKVRVDRKGESLATLTPGNKVTWYAKEQKAVTATVNANSLIDWKDGMLLFDHLSMSAIAEELQRRFNVQINIIDAEVNNNKVSGSFPAGKTIDQVLKALAVAGKFRYESNNNGTFRIFQLK